MSERVDTSTDRWLHIGLHILGYSMLTMGLFLHLYSINATHQLMKDYLLSRGISLRGQVISCDSLQHWSGPFTIVMLYTTTTSISIRGGTPTSLNVQATQQKLSRHFQKAFKFEKRSNLDTSWRYCSLQNDQVWAYQRMWWNIFLRVTLTLEQPYS
jgi:hypothetical protein